jgi:stearoyl-CoA desaturase (delta-9 desaturase)
MTAPKWFERLLALLGVCTMQDTPACWVAMHRIHHQHSDHQPDPHSPLVTFFWGHFGWLMFENREFTNVHDYQRFTRDLLKDPFYMNLERRSNWLKIYIAVAMLYPIVGFLIGWITSGNLWGGVQFGASLLVWGVFVRTVLNWHITWSVNSVTHVWGYRNYETKDNSRNNWIIGLISNGEGWHNNHHADQRAAAHGHRWWEFDVSWLTILAFEKLGLVSDVVRPQAWKSKESPSRKPR